MPCWANFYEAASQFDPLNPEPLLDIINSGAHLDLPDRDGLTLLHYAAREGHYDAVRMLVEVGVKLEIQDREYVQRRVNPRPPSPLPAAPSPAARSLSLSSSRRGRTPLHLACLYANYPQRTAGSQHVEIAKYLQHEHANTSTADKYNRVPLSYLPQSAKKHGVVSSVALRTPAVYEPRSVWAVEQVVHANRAMLGAGGGVLDGSVAQASAIILRRP